MSKATCSSCYRPKATFSCDVCQEPLCKDCEEFLDESTFSFLREVPEILRHTHYCRVCYDQNVAQALESYNEILERARSVYFFFKTQKRQLPIVKRSKESVRVEACEDRDETILRLAFFAAEMGFNAVIEAEVTSEKIRNQSYQKSAWQGVGVPAEVDAIKLERRT